MKTFRLLCVVLALALPQTAAAAKIEVTRSVSVTGEGEVRVVPNEAIILMTVESRDKELMTALNRNNKAVQAVTGLAKNKFKVQEKHVQADYVNIRPQYVNCRREEEMAGRCDPTKIAYYQISRGIMIRLQNLQRFDKLMTEALGAGATHINEVEFRTTQLRKHRDTARAMAAKAAKEKAAAAAAALGAKLGPVTSISVDTGYIGYRASHRRAPMTQNAMMDTTSGGDSGEVSLGQISVTATTSATFALE